RHRGLDSRCVSVRPPQRTRSAVGAFVCATCRVTRGRHGGTLMRKTLLATVAAAAVAAGTIAVSAQGMQGGTGGAGGPGGAGGGGPSATPAPNIDKGGAERRPQRGGRGRASTRQGARTERRR